MVRIPSSAEIDKRYREAIGRASSRYKDGVQATTGWQAAAIAGESNYAAGVAAAAADGRRAKALGAVSDSEWQRKATDLGAARIGPGMTANADKRTKNYEPIRSALASLSLPARTQEPMANIDARLKPVVEAEIAAKRSRLGI